MCKESGKEGRKSVEICGKYEKHGFSVKKIKK